MSVGYLVVGPAGHGVVEIALATAATSPVVVSNPFEVEPARFADVSVVHVHLTDRLFGESCESAAAAFCELVDRLARPVIVTLHDLPMGGPGDRRWERRAAAYARVVAASAGVVTSSRHEAGLLAATGAPERPAAVIALPIDRLPDPEVRPDSTAEVGVLGWIYPGKGHDEVAAALPPGLGMAALGGVSPGHFDLVESLRSQLGDRLRCTGFLPEASMLAELRRVAIPVAAHHNVSASASVGSWLAAGRRPLVADGPWARELLERCPGSLALYPPGELADRLADPPETWLGEVWVGPGAAQITLQLLAFCESV